METTTKRITVTRSFTYDIEDVKLSYKEIHDHNITDDEAIELIEQWAEQDMLSPLSRHDLVFMDSDTGEEI